MYPFITKVDDIYILLYKSTSAFYIVGFKSWKSIDNISIVMAIKYCLLHNSVLFYFPSTYFCFTEALFAYLIPFIYLPFSPS